MERRGLRARELPLEEIPEGKVKDYLLASAACFPALRARDIDGVKYQTVDNVYLYPQGNIKELYIAYYDQFWS